VASGFLATGVDGTIFEPNQPQLVKLEIPLDRLSGAWDGFRIVQLSDFHYDDYFSVIPIRKAVDMINTLDPDLIVLTGDFVTVAPFSRHFHRGGRGRARFAEVAEPCAALLGKLRSRLGSVAIMGNHDAASDPDRITAILQAHGIQVLINRSMPLEQRGSRLWLAGIDDVLEGEPDLSLTLKGIPSHEPVVLLAHEPDFALDAAQSPVDLQLSGHSHGGQVRLPLIGAPILPEMGTIFPWGLHRVGQLTLYTNVGIGTVRVVVRLNCPPEVTLITLRASAGA